MRSPPHATSTKSIARDVNREDKIAMAQIRASIRNPSFTAHEKKCLSRLILQKEKDKALQRAEKVRPKKRSDCVNGIRPCPWVGCKYNMFLDVTRQGAIKFNRGDGTVDDILRMKKSCALDIADEGGIVLEETASLLRLTRERIRQIEFVAIARLGISHKDLAPDGCDADERRSFLNEEVYRMQMAGRAKRKVMDTFLKGEDDATP